MRLVEVCPAQVRANELRLAEVRPVELRPAEVRPEEVGSTEVRRAEVRHDIRLFFPPLSPMLIPSSPLAPPRTGRMPKARIKANSQSRSSSKLTNVITHLYATPDPRLSSCTPKRYVVEVKHGSYFEAWTEGMNLFHNPSALYPIDPDSFVGAGHHFLEDGRIVSRLPEFHPYNSTTTSFTPDRLKE